MTGSGKEEQNVTTKASLSITCLTLLASGALAQRVNLFLNQVDLRFNPENRIVVGLVAFFDNGQPMFEFPCVGRIPGVCGNTERKQCEQKCESGSGEFHGGYGLLSGLAEGLHEVVVDRPRLLINSIPEPKSRRTGGRNGYLREWYYSYLLR